MSAAPMTFREMNLRIFQGQPVPGVLFQPRFEPWYHWHEIFHAMPPAYAGMSVRDLYDALGVSMRYMHYYTGVADPVEQVFAPRLILGVSDEVPEGLGKEAIQRVGLVADLCRSYSSV